MSTWRLAGDRAEFVHRIWPAQAPELAPIRVEVRRWLRQLDLTDDAQDGVVIAVDEAVTNTVGHAYDPEAMDGVVELTFWTETSALCIEVVDHGVWREPAGRPGSGGLGMALMQRLVPTVLIRHDARGTRVLLRHPLPARIPVPRRPRTRAPALVDAAERTSPGSLGKPHSV